MKNFKLFKLLLLGIVMIMSGNQMWAWTSRQAKSTISHVYVSGSMNSWSTNSSEWELTKVDQNHWYGDFLIMGQSSNYEFKLYLDCSNNTYDGHYSGQYDYKSDYTGGEMSLYSTDKGNSKIVPVTSSTSTYIGIRVEFYAEYGSDDHGYLRVTQYQYGTSLFSSGSTLYLDADGMTTDARFAAVFCKAETQTWVDMSQVGSTNFYSLTLSADYPMVIFCRMNGSQADNTWDNRWNQSADLTPNSSYNCYDYTSYGDGNRFNGTWRTVYTVTAAVNNASYGSASSNKPLLYNSETATITASPNTGYKVTNWAKSGTGASISPSGASNSTTTTLTMGTANATVTATLAAKTYTADNNINANGGSNGKYTATFNATTIAINTAPVKAGYSLDGYYGDEDCTIYIADASGNLQASKSVGGNEVTNSSKQWKRDANITLYAKWTEVPLSLNASGNWSTAANWSPACVPTIKHDVTITKPVTVDVANAQAKSIVLDQSAEGKTGQLTVSAGKALVVATTIQKKTNSGTVATEETDIVLESDGTNGTGALVAGSASTTTKATVHFYSKAKKDGSGNYINQYFGIPADSVSKLNYYGSYLQKYDQPTDSWISFTEESKMGPWTAYRILREETSEGTYEVSGTLLLPGTSDGKTKTLTVNTSTHDGDNMFANSWAAPIYIPAMVTNDETPDFSGVTATIYIYNAGSLSDYTYGSTYANKTASPGQWVCLPVKTVAGDKSNYLTVIPSQQAFLVQTSTGGSLTLDYKKHVYDPAVTSGATIVPTYAPQRTQDNDLEKMRLYLAGESGASDRLMMYMREDFTAGFDDGWEGFKLPGSEFVPQLCAYSDAGEMSINAINDAEGTVLGFYAGTEDSEYTFTFGYEGDNVWYLNDLEAQQSTLINAASSYNFSAVPGTVAERRFVISHTPIANTPTGIDNSEAVEGTQARKQMINGILYIIRGGQIYSTDGQIVK